MGLEALLKRIGGGTTLGVVNGVKGAIYGAASGFALNIVSMNCRAIDLIGYGAYYGGLISAGAGFLRGFQEKSSLTDALAQNKDVPSSVFGIAYSIAAGVVVGTLSYMFLHDNFMHEKAIKAGFIAMQAGFALGYYFHYDPNKNDPFGTSTLSSYRDGDNGKEDDQTPVGDDGVISD